MLLLIQPLEVGRLVKYPAARSDSSQSCMLYLRTGVQSI